MAQIKAIGRSGLHLLASLDWWHIPLLSLAGAMLWGAWIFSFVPLRYTACTSLLLSERPDAITSLAQSDIKSAASQAGLTGLIGGQPVELKRLEAVLNSRHVAVELVRKYGLAQAANGEEDQAVKSLGEMTKLKSLEDVGVTIEVTCGGASRIQMWLDQTPARSNAQAQLLCASLANEYAVALDEYVTQTSVAAARDTREFIEKRRREVSNTLAQTEDRLEALQTAHALIDPANKAEELVEITKAAVQAYAQASAECEELAHSLQTARGRLAHEDLMRIAQEMTIRNPLMTSLEERLAGLKVELATGLKSGKTAAHPDMMRIQTAIDSSEQQLAELAQAVQQEVSRQVNPAHDAVAGRVAALEIDLAGARARKAVYGGQLAQAREETVGLPPVVREYVRLARERQLQAELLTTLSTRLELATIEEQRESSSRVQVLDVAEPPRKKSGPSSVRSAKVTFALLTIILFLAVAHRRGLLIPRVGE